MKGKINGQYSSYQWMQAWTPSLGTVLANTTYTLDLKYAWHKDWGQGHMPSGSKVQLYLNGQEFKTTLIETPQQDTFTPLQIQVVIDAAGNLVSYTSDTGPTIGTALAGGSIGIRLAIEEPANAGKGPEYVMFDGLVLDDGTPIPEPATMSLLALGGLGALLRRRRS